MSRPRPCSRRPGAARARTREPLRRWYKCRPPAAPRSPAAASPHRRGKRALKIPPPSLRGQLKLALRIAPPRSALCAVRSCHCRPASLQLRQSPHRPATQTGCSRAAARFAGNSGTATTTSSLASLALQSLDRSRQQPAKRLRNRPHPLILQQVDHLAQFVLDTPHTQPPARTSAAPSRQGEHSSPSSGKLSSKPNPFHIESFAADAGTASSSAGGTPSTHSSQTGASPSAQQRPPQTRQSRRIKRSYKVIQNSPNHRFRLSQ